MVETLDIRPAIRIASSLPDLASFQRLRAQTGWGAPDDDTINFALKNSLFGAVAIDGTETIGMVRVVGDGAINVYIQDVIVAKNLRGLGIGRRLVQSAIQWMHDTLPSTVTVGLMAADGQSHFYNAFGFTARPAPRFGPGMHATLSDLSV